MHPAKGFLENVLHSEGHPCVVGIKDKKIKQIFVQSVDEIIEVAVELDKQSFNAYFACATFKKPTTRTQDNVAWLRTLFIDIDCGPGKPYPDQPTALVELKKFINATKIPLPTIVNSGRGIHAYWTFAAPVAREEWEPVALQLKAALAGFGLQADPAVTADSARILRIPGTRNFKVPGPGNDVGILAYGKDVRGHDEYASLLANYQRENGGEGAQPTLRLGYAVEQSDPITEALIGNIDASFKKILRKTARGTGCEQLRIIYEAQANLAEPLWRAGLSIAAHCKDSGDAIHIISGGHPDYSRAETERKAAQIKGPYTCETFAGLDPAPCQSCPNQGKITSPIQLGKVIKEAAPLGPSVAAPDGLSTPSGFQPVKLPEGYFRGTNGGIYRHIKIEGEWEDLLIYEHDFFVTKRFHDAERGDVIELSLKLPHDDERKFTMPMRHLADRNEARQRFAEKGIALIPKSMDNLIDYIINWANHLEHMEKADVTRAQMGWTEEETFILGDTEITHNGPRYTPPAPATMNVVSAIGQKGKLEEWKKVMDIYSKPGMEAQAFAVLAGIGAVLFKWTHCDGVILNLISNASGSGKTTLCRAICSAYGHPKDLMMMWDDTKLFKYQRIGVLSNLPVIVDEITNWPPEVASDFAYGITQGRGRHRMKGSANEERMNITKWSTIAVTTSNASLYDKIGSIKSMPEGELYRIFELHIPRLNQIPKEEADQIFYKLSDNYGHAGFMFVDYLVNNLAGTKDRLRRVQVDFDKAAGMTTAERNWSALMACAFTTGLILTKDVPLLNTLNLDRIYNYMKEKIGEVRVQANKQVLTGSSLLGQYLNEIIYNNTLVIESSSDKRNKLNVKPLREPRGKLLFRVEPDKKLGYLSLGEFRNYCSKNMVSYTEIRKHLEQKAIITAIRKMRLGKGTDVNTPPVEALLLDMSHPDFDFDAVLNSDEAAEAQQG